MLLINREQRNTAAASRNNQTHQRWPTLHKIGLFYLVSQCHKKKKKKRGWDVILDSRLKANNLM